MTRLTTHRAARVATLLLFAPGDKSAHAAFAIAFNASSGVASGKTTCAAVVGIRLDRNFGLGSRLWHHYISAENQGWHCCRQEGRRHLQDRGGDLRLRT